MTVLLNEIETILAANNRALKAELAADAACGETRADRQSILYRPATIADLAKDIGRDYHQVYGWLRVRRFNPGATGLMLLMQWRNKWIGNLSVASGESRRVSPAAEKQKKRRRRFTSWR